MTYRCPVCLQEADRIYQDKDREIVGCENCVTHRDIEDVVESEERLAENAYAEYLLQYEREVRYGLC